MALNASQIKTLQSGAHADTGGLYLIVRKNGSRRWAFRFTGTDGKRAQMEFASAGDGHLSLSDARNQARAYHLALKKDGIDPRHKKKADEGASTTFADFWNAHYETWCKGKNPDESKAWRRSLRDVPGLHKLTLGEIDTPHVIEALKKIWHEKPITANRTRGRIEKVLDAAKVERLRTGENPAAWRGNLKFVFQPARRLNKKRGHASVSYEKAPALMAALDNDGARVARCVEVGILTATRSQEIRLMEWTEIDFKKRTWLIPGEKMKIKGDTAEGKPHLVPLSDQAIAIIKSMPRAGRFVFPSDHVVDHQPFFPNALTECIKRAVNLPATMHGMRTTFRNWGADDETHNFRREVLEFCLAHRVGDEAERSYWNSDMINRRRVVMAAWANFLKPTKA